MGIYEGNDMRSMTLDHFNDTKMNKSKELNDTMSIDTSKSEDSYGQQVHSLSKRELESEGGQ